MSYKILKHGQNPESLKLTGKFVYQAKKTDFLSLDWYSKLKMELKMAKATVKFVTLLSKLLHLTYLLKHIWKAKQTTVLCQWVKI